MDFKLIEKMQTNSLNLFHPSTQEVRYGKQQSERSGIEGAGLPGEGVRPRPKFVWHRGHQLVGGFAQWFHGMFSILSIHGGDSASGLCHACSIGPMVECPRHCLCVTHHQQCKPVWSNALGTVHNGGLLVAILATRMLAVYVGQTFKFR